MTPAEALAALTSKADADKAAQMLNYHKVPRRYLGVSNPEIDALTKAWRPQLTLPARVDLAAELWKMNIFETRLAATKLLTQARIKPDDSAVWALIVSWLPDLDSWALADHAMMAGQRRVTADPERLDTVESWTTSDHMWTRRAALVITLPWAKQRHPKPEEYAIRDRVLTWAAGYVDDTDWFIQKAVAWWLRDLSRKDPDRTRNFLAAYGPRMKPFARKEAARLLPQESG